MSKIVSKDSNIVSNSSSDSHPASTSTSSDSGSRSFNNPCSSNESHSRRAPTQNGDDDVILDAIKIPNFGVIRAQDLRFMNSSSRSHPVSHVERPEDLRSTSNSNHVKFPKTSMPPEDTQNRDCHEGLSSSDIDRIVDRCIEELSDLEDDDDASSISDSELQSQYNSCVNYMKSKYPQLRNLKFISVEEDDEEEDPAPRRISEDDEPEVIFVGKKKPVWEVITLEDNGDTHDDISEGRKCEDSGRVLPEKPAHDVIKPGKVPKLEDNGDNHDDISEGRKCEDSGRVLPEKPAHDVIKPDEVPKLEDNGDTHDDISEGRKCEDSGRVLPEKPAHDVIKPGKVPKLEIDDDVTSHVRKNSLKVIDGKI